MASVEDLDELLATRKINGLDDGLYKEDIKTLKEELEQKNKEFDNYLATHKDYLSVEAEVIRKDIHRLINKIALLEKSATKKEENVVNMTEEAFNEIIDNFEVVAYLTEYGRKGIKENVKKLQARIKELDTDLTTAYLKGYADAEEKYRQKVKDKIEELKQKAIGYGPLIDKDKAFRIECEIKILEELLEENKLI